MQDRFKFRYIFEKNYGGSIGKCYKMPIFDLEDIHNEEFHKKVKEYTDYDYKLKDKLQCTGFKDIYKTLIFEKDILKGPNGIIDVVEWYYGNYIWNGQAISSFDIGYQGDKWAQESREFEIIGNIYENPELLN